MEVKDEDLQLSPQFKKAILEAQKQGTQNKNMLKTQLSKKVELNLFFKQKKLIKDLYIHNPKQKYTILHDFLTSNFKLTNNQADIELIKRFYLDSSDKKTIVFLMVLIIFLLFTYVYGISSFTIVEIVLFGFIYLFNFYIRLN